MISSRDGSTIYLLSPPHWFDVSQIPIIKPVAVTIMIALGVVLLSTGSALFVAWLAYRKLRGVGIYRSFLIWGMLLSPIVSGQIMLIIFQTDSGLLDRLATSWGLPPTHWLVHGGTALLAVILTLSWMQFGGALLLLVAAMQGIPGNLLNAAELDGAGLWKKFRIVIYPSIKPIVVYVVFVDLLGALFGSYGIIRVLTSGGPDGATTSLGYLLYKTGISHGDVGRATAQSMILLLLVLAITRASAALNWKRNNSTKMGVGNI